MIAPLFRSPSFLARLYPQLTWRIPNEEKKIYLTFDDGPIPDVTEFVLNELGERRTKATFFCIGDNVRKNRSIFEKLKDQGHCVGNHTYHHVSGWRSDSNKYLKDVNDCLAEMKMDSKLFRPPYGRITRKQIKALAGYQIIMWDVLSFDYSRISAERCLNGTLKAVRDGSIIVFHDSIKAEKNLRFVLPRFLDQVLDWGYLPELIPLKI